MLSGVDLNLALPYLSPVQSAEDTAPLHAFGSLDGPIARSFSNTLIVTYMIDEPGGALVFVRERDIENNDRAREELHRRAIENLRAHAQRRKLRFETKGALQIAKLDGQHDASLLLLDELWDPPTRIMDPDGELIAAVPSRNILLFTGSTTRGGLPELRASCMRAPLSPEVLVRRKGDWESFLTQSW
jgi:hypothetical protein